MKFYKKIFITAILLVNIFICSVFAGKEQDDFEFGLKLFQQDPSMAADQFEKFISTYPRSSSIADAYLWLGQCYQILEQYDSSILKFSVITVNYPKYHNLDIAVFNLGLGYYYKNEFENAIFQFNKYIKISSSTTAKKKKNSENLRAASIYIGDCYFNTGKYDKAIETYKNENDSKEDISLSFKLFKAYYLNKQYDKALDISDKFNFEQSDTGLLSDLDRQRFYFYTGDIYFAKKNHEKALSYLTAVEKFSIKPDFINLVLLRISQCYDMLNNQDKSIEYLLKIESTGMPHYLNEVPYRIGLIYYNSGRYDIASNYFVTGLKKYPDIIREDLLALSINALYKADKLNDLIYVYENFAVKNKISNLEILEKTVYAYYTLNKYDDVLKISSIIKLTDDQKYFNIKFFEASSYFHLKKHQKSITELKLLLTIKSIQESLKIKIFKLLGDNYFELGDYKTAENQYLEIADVESKDLHRDEIYAKIGLCYIKQNKIELVEALIKVIYEKYIDSYNLNYMLFSYSKTTPDKIKKEYYLNEIVKNSKSEELINNSLYQLALINFENKQYHTGISNLKKINSKELEHEKNYLIAAHYFYLDEYRKSIDFLNKTKPEFVEPDKYYKLMLLNYYNLKQYSNSLQYAGLLSDKEKQVKTFYTAVSEYYLGDFKNSNKLFETYINNYPGSDNFFEALYFYGISLYKLGDYSKSKLTFLQLENKKSESKIGYKKYLAYLYLIENNIDKTLRTINEYENEMKKSLNEIDIAEINFIKGQSYYELKNYSKSIEYLNKISVNHAQSAGFIKEYHLLKANCYQALFNYSEANSNYFSFTKLSNEVNLLTDINLKILMNMSKLMHYKDVISHADMISEKYKLSQEDEILRILQKAKAYFQMQNYDETINFLNANNIPENNYNIEKMFIIAGAYFNKKDYKNSNKYYLELLDKYSDNKYSGDIKMAVATNYKLLGDMDNFEKFKINIVNSASDENSINESMFELAAYYYSVQKFDSSVYYLNRIINISNDRIILEKSYRQLANVFFKQKEYAKSIEIANLYLKIYHESKDIDKNEVNLILADNYFSSGEFTKSIEIYNRLPKNDYTLYQKCLSYFNMNNYDNSIKLASEFTASFPNSRYIYDAKFIAAYSYYKLNQMPASIKILNDIYEKISNESNKIIALQILIEFYMSVKDHQNAIKWLTIQSENPKLSTPAADYNLSEVYYSAGDYSNAVKHIMKIINSSDFESVKQKNYRKLVDCYIKLKNYNMALSTIELYDSKSDGNFIILKSELLSKSGNDTEMIKICIDYIAKLNVIEQEIDIKIINIALDKYKNIDKKSYFDFYKNLTESKTFKDKNVLANFIADLADSFYNENDFNNALVYYWKIILSVEARDFFEYTYFKIINCYLKINDIAKAKYQYNNFKTGFPKSKYLYELNKNGVLTK